MFSTIFSRTFIIFMFVFGTIKLAKSRCLPLDFYSNNGLSKYQLMTLCINLDITFINVI